MDRSGKVLKVYRFTRIITRNCNFKALHDYFKYCFKAYFSTFIRIMFAFSSSNSYSTKVKL